MTLSVRERDAPFLNPFLFTTHLPYHLLMSRGEEGKNPKRRSTKNSTYCASKAPPARTTYIYMDPMLSCLISDDTQSQNVEVTSRDFSIPRNLLVSGTSKSRIEILNYQSVKSENTVIDCSSDILNN